MRILLIEDNDALRTVMRRMLAPLGCDIQEASDGKAGLIAYRTQRSDVVITDILMPEADGLETIGALRRLDPAVKIIAISGGGRGSAGDYLETAQKMGARRVLVKPFSPEELRTAVAQLLVESAGG
jgi:CheY-like chemotaxis protein